MSEEVGMTKEEAAKIAADEVQDDDEFEECFEEEDGIDGKFRVSQEELSIIRAELACEFPDDYTYLSDEYILSVASKPYSKDPTIRRPLEYTMEKLTHVMQWRAEMGAPSMPDLVKLANGPETAPEAVENPEDLAKAKALVSSLNNGSLYWHGFTKTGEPILWVRCNRKPWYPDVDAEINNLILIADTGIRNMPKGVTEFVVVSDSTSPPPPNPTFMVRLLKALVKGYPDRLHILYSAPVSSIVQFVMNLLLPLMPGRLASKVCLSDVDKMKETLAELLEGGEEDIPTFFGGPADHDQFYPDESACSIRGQGSLKFDYYGMVERLEKAKVQYEQNHANDATTEEEPNGDK